VAQDRQTDAARHDGLLAAVDRRLRLQQVLGGLDEKGVRSPVDEPLGLQRERLLQVVVRRMAQRGQLRPGPHRAEDPPHPSVRRLGRLRPLASDRGALLGELGDAVVDAVVGEVRPVRAERVGLHCIHADRVVRVVDAGDDVRARDVQDLVAALEPLEIALDRQLVALEHRAHRAVGDDDALVDGIQQSLRTRRAVDAVDVQGETGPRHPFSRSSRRASSASAARCRGRSAGPRCRA
jgi:hypothetical protein